MRVFLAGGSGVIGRRLVPRLVAAGHDVVASTRSPGKIAALAAAGATPVIVDALDETSYRSAILQAAPDAVIHQLTALPPKFDPRKLSEMYEANDQIRRATAVPTIEAAREAGAKKVIAQSIAFMYRPEGNWVKNEDAPLYDDGSEPIGGVVRAMTTVEDAVLAAEGLDGIVLRYGFFYGPGTWYAPDGNIAREMHRRMVPVIGAGTGHWSWVHVDDAADATVQALTFEGSGVFNIVDDDPAPQHEWVPLYAKSLGAPRPLHVPGALIRLVAGSIPVEMAKDLRGASNAKAKGALGWSPAHPSWRDGFFDQESDATAV